MKEKEREKNETEKWSEKIKFQCRNRTRDLLICSQSSLPHSYRLSSGIVLNLPTYTANLNGHNLRVASLAALAPPII